MKGGEKQRTRHRPQAAPVVSVPAALTTVSCPACGFAVELWSGEEETCCFACDHKLSRKQRVVC